MKSDFECLVCMMKQALNTVTVATDDVQLQREVINRVARLIPETDLNRTPAFNSQKVYDVVSEITGVKDPFKKIKKQSNEDAIRLLPHLKKLVSDSADPLNTALHLAVAGNIIDTGIGYNYNLEKDIVAMMASGFAIEDIASFKKVLQAGRKVLYLGDNAGEIVFDRILVEEILKTGVDIVFAVKSGPIINDAMMEDARAACLMDLVEVIETGSNDIGVQLERSGKMFREKFESADMILAKGHGYFETCSGMNDERFYFLLTAKCAVVARELGVQTGETAFKRSGR